MRVAVFGYQTWGHKTLATLLNSRHEVVLVATHPRSPHAYESIWADSVEDLARDHNVALHIAKRPDNEMIDRVKHAEPDIIVANNWRTWLPRELFDLPPHGTLNIHDSLLPKFTGFSPVVSAVIAGESETGLTAHRMDDSLDTGDIIVQRAIPIGPHDTGADLVRATINLIPPVLLESLDVIETGRAQWTPQDLDQRSFFHKRSDRDSLIDWTWTADELERFVRALNDPFPNAYTFYQGQRIRVVRAAVSHGRYGGTPGRVFIEEGGGMVIVAGAGAHRGTNQGLVLHRIRTDDGTEHAAVDFFRHAGGYLVSTP